MTWLNVVVVFFLFFVVVVFLLFVVVVFCSQVVQSCMVGLKKPEQPIFDLILKKLEVEPHEAVFLDDLGRNLKTARLMGMTTIKVCIFVTNYLRPRPRLLSSNQAIVLCL